jgi:hypothetical protein
MALESGMCSNVTVAVDVVVVVVVVLEDGSIKWQKANQQKPVPWPHPNPY